MLEMQFLNNSLETWLVAFAIAMVSILVARVLYWIIQKTVKSYAQKTKNNLDLIFIDMVEEPIIFSVVLLGIWFALDTLVMAQWAHDLIGNAFYFAIAFNVAWFITRLFDALVEHYLVPKVKASETDLDDILLPIVRKLLKISIWVMATIIAIDNAGYDVTTMLAGVGIGGLVFALAAKDAVSNIFGGVIIFSDKPFNINDRIVLNGHEGYVREIGLRSIKVETLEGRMVTIPNSKVTDSAVLNISQEPGRKIKFKLGLTYDTPPEQIALAKQILSEILVEHQEVYKPVIAFDSFGDFSLNILVIYWVQKGAPIIEVTDAINMEILKRFNENRLNFAFPTQSIILEK